MLSEAAAVPERSLGAERRAAARTELRKLSVVVLTCLAIAGGVLGQRSLAYDRDELRGELIWGVALALFVAALWQARGVLASSALAIAEHAAGQRSMAISKEAALLAGVLASGVFFRFWRLNPRLPPWDDAIPRGLNHDAAFNGLYAITIHQHPGYTWLWQWAKEPYVPDGFTGENMFHYLLATSQYVFGYTEFAIEFTAAAIGVATLVAFYFLLRRLFDARLALIGTFLLGVSGWHITFSKVGWSAILVPLFVCLVFVFLVKALQEYHTRDFVLSGIFLGLGLDTYNGARILPFLVVAYVLYEVVRQPSIVRTRYRQLGLFALAFAVSYAPVAIWALRHQDLYTSRANALWIGDQIRAAGSLRPLFTNIKNALLMFNFRANGDDFYRYNEPLLDMPMAVFFTFGLVYSLVRFRQRGAFLMLVILTGTLAVGVASRPNGNRSIGAVIPTTAFAAVFLFEAWRWMSEAYPDVRHTFTAVLIGALVFTGWATYDNYLGPSLPNVEFAKLEEQWGFYPETTRVGHYLHDRVDEGFVIHVGAGNWPNDALTYLSYPGEGGPRKLYTYTTKASELATIGPSDEAWTVYVVENRPESAGTVLTLFQQYPSAEADNIYYPDGSDTVIGYGIRVPPGGGPGSKGPLPVPGAAERDAVRTTELKRLVDALNGYYERRDKFPDTGYFVQSACVYVDLDAGCALLPDLGGSRDAFSDDRGDVNKFGYWYRSDGDTFTLFAVYENGVPPEYTCTAEEASLAQFAGKPGLACIHSAP